MAFALALAVLLEGLLKGVPGESGALDAHRELADSLEDFQVTEVIE